MNSDRWRDARRRHASLDRFVFWLVASGLVLGAALVFLRWLGPITPIK